LAALQSLVYDLLQWKSCSLAQTLAFQLKSLLVSQLQLMQEQQESP
jgi:hypothetical protein